MFKKKKKKKKWWCAHIFWFIDDWALSGSASPLPLPASAVWGKVSQLTGGASPCVLDAAEVHPVRNVAGLLSQYICALIGFTGPGSTLISTLQLHQHLKTGLTLADFYQHSVGLYRSSLSIELVRFMSDLLILALRLPACVWLFWHSNFSE